MKLDAEKFLAITVLLATTAGAPACGKKEDKKAAKVEDKAIAPTPSAPGLGPAGAAQAAQPPATPPAPAVAPVDPAAPVGAGAGAGSGAAKPDPGPEEEKPSW